MPGGKPCPGDVSFSIGADRRATRISAASRKRSRDDLRVPVTESEQIVRDARTAATRYGIPRQLGSSIDGLPG